MAKEQKQAQPPPNPEEAEEVVQPKSYRMHIALGIVALILFQMIVLWLMLPSRKEVLGEIGTPTGFVPPEGFDQPTLVPPEVVTTEIMDERPIREGNKFTVSNVREGNNETFSIVFFVEVRRSDVRKFDRMYPNRESAIIDRITGILHASTTEERNEIGYTTIKERVRRGINDVLGTPWVQQVLIRDPSFTSN